MSDLFNDNFVQRGSCGQWHPFYLYVNTRANYVLLPYHPHFRFKPLKDVFAPAFKNVYQFNLSTWKGKEHPIVTGKRKCG